MKITDNRPVTGVAKPRRTAPAGAVGSVDGAQSPARARSINDVASFLGITPEELTPNVREGLTKLIAEVRRLRREVERHGRRIAYLERLADEDPLTPILNRRAFVRELSRMMAFAERYGAPSSVLYFDVNGMKRINDQYGHNAGDAALTHVADLLVGHVRASDVVGRLGGDEFGIVLAQADEGVASMKGGQLCDLIRQRPFDWEGEPISVDVSFGAFTFYDRSEPDEALSRADQAMYEQKRARGGGRRD
jgi:diguanylate cyclase (GGDEF)-like protein